MTSENTNRLLKELKVDTIDNYMIINGVKIPIQDKSVIKLFDYLSEFSITTDDKDLLSKYFGISTDEPMTLEKLSEEYNKSGERIRQVMQSALRKITHRLNKNRSYDRFVREVRKSDGVVEEQI